ncbi:MAG: hypothetical protein ABIG64_06835 [Candidatus Omnitrophota bacterium]
MYKKTKALTRIEANIETVEPGSLRQSILICAKNFKSSWLELGQHLMTVHKDKHYKDWGYLTFESYAQKEIGIRKQTALKLLKSYYFLEQEEPQYIRKEYLESLNTPQVPSYESVNVIRQAKTNKAIGIADYERIKRHVLEEGKPEKEVKDVYRSMLKAVKEADPETARISRRINHVRRIIGMLNSIKREVKLNKFLSDSVLDELDKIINKINMELS